jgi:hypothetical protein
VGPPFSQDSPGMGKLKEDNQSSLVFIYQNMLLQSEKNEVHVPLSKAFQYIKTLMLD